MSTPEQAQTKTLEQLILDTDTKYHTDVFIIKTLNFKPTQTENILRNNYAAATTIQLNNKFDGIPDADNLIALSDIHKELFPNTQSFIDYIMARPHALAYIISRKADISDKRKEVHELGLDEMRAILTAPNLCPNPNYSYKDKMEAEANGHEYNIPEMITDYKAQNLKVSVFKHLDTAQNKTIIHQQNIEIKLLGKNPNNPNGLNGNNPTLIGHMSSGNMPNISTMAKRRISSKPDKDSYNPRQFMDDIISENPESEMMIDVTPMKAELMKQPEQELIEKLENLREQEKVAQHIPKSKQSKVKTEEVF